MKLYNEHVFVTGCDYKTEWQLPWFLSNFLKYHDERDLIICDFGMSKEFLDDVCKKHTIIQLKNSRESGWFKKPRTMVEVSRMPNVKKTCWIDTDCEVRGKLYEIFNLTHPFKLSMVEDRPWTNRRPKLGTWFNSGVVCFENTPEILKMWMNECVKNPREGDQEVLYYMFEGDELLKMRFIEVLHPKWNTLRLDYIDNINVKNPLVVHHTGQKGKQKIREIMNESECSR